ncbi:MAG: hypothetical protein JXB62_09825 [Pirellulales bacterium]|nr:hypothetical protein [Pirellulales bacterium]
MEARLARAALLAAVLSVSMGARFRAPNFIVETADPKLAEQIATAAEQYRRDLAVEWLGKAMPNWSRPCMMTVRVGPNLGAGGATTFVFDRGEVYDWRMTIQGSRQRILDSVLPHEITHMIFASHFRCPLPRWADEGGATCVEHASERQKHQRMLVQFLRTGRGIAFSRMLAMTQYPPDVMPLYAQGFSVVEFLIQLGGKRKYIDFLADGMKTDQWSAAIRRHYGIADAGTLQNTWLAWIRRGSPPLKPRNASPAARPSPEMLAAVPGGEVQAAVAVSDGTPTASPISTVALADSASDSKRGSIYQRPGALARRFEPYAPGSVIPATSSRDVDGPTGPDRQTEPQRLPTSGWYAAGTEPPRSLPKEVASQPPSPPPARSVPTVLPPVRSHLTRPQPYEPSRQIILEWCAPGGG